MLLLPLVPMETENSLLDETLLGLHLGCQGVAARKLQEFLASLGCYSGVIKDNFTEETALCLQTFQKKIGIPPTGFVDKRTYRAIERLQQFLF